MRPFVAWIFGNGGNAIVIDEKDNAGMDEHKPTVFVSHAAQDARIATQFKADIEDNFLGLCTVFVSSNLESISPGAEWVAEIKSNIQKCAVLIGLISPVALTRGWVYFEFGAGWARNIPVIPVCHSGLLRENLPPPVSVFQALDLVDKEHLKSVYKVISDTIHCRVPSADFDALSKKYLETTEVRRIAVLLQGWLRQIITWNPEVQRLVDGGKDEVRVLVPMPFEAPFGEFRQVAQQRGLLVILPSGMAIGTSVGAQASVFQFRRGNRASELKDFLSDPPTTN